MFKIKFYFKDKTIHVSINAKKITKENPTTIKTFLEDITSCTDKTLSLFTQSNERIDTNNTLYFLCGLLSSNKNFIITTQPFKKNCPQLKPTNNVYKNISNATKGDFNQLDLLLQNKEYLPLNYHNALIPLTNHFHVNDVRRNALNINPEHLRLILTIRDEHMRLLYDENGVNRLVEMGFPRERAIISMRMGNNNLEDAANIIVGERDWENLNFLAVSNDEVRIYENHPFLQVGDIDDNLAVQIFDYADSDDSELD